MIDAERLPKRGLQEGAPVKPRGFREARDRSSIETRDLSQTGYETAMGSVSCTLHTTSRRCAARRREVAYPCFRSTDTYARQPC